MIIYKKNIKLHLSIIKFKTNPSFMYFEAGENKIDEKMDSKNS